MDEGRLAVVFRREEQHRKFVYVMNDIVRARLSVYSNCLAREQHESSVKLLKNCSEVRRSIVRQKVLKKCLEMRKRKIVERDPTKTFGQYGGKPLWAMSREIDDVIADNHPKIRRMKRVEEVMRKSLESGAILDDEAVSRRMDAFFQLKEAQRQKQKSPQRAPKLSQAPLQRRNVFKPPSWAVNPGDVSQGSTPSQSMLPASTDLPGHSGQRKHGGEDRAGKEKLPDSNRTQKDFSDTENQKYSGRIGVTSRVSLDVDSSGRLRGIITSRFDDTESKAELKKQKNTSPGGRRESGSGKRSSRREHADSVRSRDSKEGDSGVDLKAVQNGVTGNSALTRSRSTLILPPIEPTRAMVTRT